MSTKSNAEQAAIFLLVVFFLLMPRLFSYQICELVSANGSISHYIISNGVANRIDHSTSNFLISHHGEKKVIPIDEAILAEFKRGRDIEPIVRKEVSVDENHRLELLKIDALQERLIRNITLIGTNMKNPTISLWNGQPLIISEDIRSRWQLRFAWAKFPTLNAFQYPVRNESLFGISSSFGGIGASRKELRGIDQRVLVVSDELVVILFTITFITYPNEIGAKQLPQYRVAVAELRKNTQTNEVSLSARPLEYDDTREYWTPRNPMDHDKNWAPFLYTNSSGSFVYIVHTVNPLRIVAFDAGEDPIERTSTRTVSAGNDSAQEKNSSSPNFAALGKRTFIRLVSAQEWTYMHRFWDYGELRGGTNAVLVRAKKNFYGGGNFTRGGDGAVSSGLHEFEDRYLAFFHTRPKLKGNGKMLTTYFMGAYTFSAHPPFRLLQISAAPYIDDRFYNGAWISAKVRANKQHLHTKRRKVANLFAYSHSSSHTTLINFQVTYCVYPTSLSVEGNKISIIMGYNDVDAYLLEMKLDEVLDSLVYV